MKKLVLLIAITLTAYPLMAQEEEPEEIKEGWNGSGTFSLMFSQAAFNSDWQAGGTSNYAGDLSIDYNIDYIQDRLSWNNNLIGEYGATKQKGERFTRKTNDKLQLNSILGYKVEEDSDWSYSFFLDFKTQFAKGYNYSSDNQVRTEYTRFMSPGYLKFGPGMLYKKEDILLLNIAPATSRFIFVDDRFTTAGDYEDGNYFGMDKGKSNRFELGASVDARSKINLMDNVVLNQKLSLFSDYLDKPQNIDIDYTLKVDMKVNKYLSANFVFQAIYEDKAISGFQIREGLGIGLSYLL